MAIKNKDLGSLVWLPLGVAAGLALASQQVAAQPWATDSERSVVTNSFEECWETAGGVTDIMVPESCGGVRDSDGDGVPDDSDQCPDTPKGVQVDSVGCPLDSDGDGVPDYLDKCPGTPRGAPVDSDGCPLDSDGDGVPDYRDKCPGTRKGAKVDSDGCEIIKVVIDSRMTNFAFDSAQLSTEARDILNGLAGQINRAPSVTAVMITGHTDSQGSEAYNQGLSERRAKSVADYLIGEGVSSSVIRTAGMGESQPIADNATRDGRARNRRVEIEVKLQ
jgi:OOP family OmpA-OmpF porin